MSQATMFETPVVASQTADGYARAMQALLTAAEGYTAREDPDDMDFASVAKLARTILRELRSADFRPREKLSLRELRHDNLRRFALACEEYEDAQHFEGGELDLRPWEALEDAVKSARRSLESAYDWAAPDDDALNPIAVREVPTPDPSVEVAPGVHQGDYLMATYWDAPRQILAGPNENDQVRLSDPRDGGARFGGLFAQASDIARGAYEVVRKGSPADDGTSS